MASVVDFLHDAYSGTKNEDKDKILWVKFEKIDTKGLLSACGVLSRVGKIC